MKGCSFTVYKFDELIQNFGPEFGIDRRLIDQVHEVFVT